MELQLQESLLEVPVLLEEKACLLLIINIKTSNSSSITDVNLQ